MTFDVSSVREQFPALRRMVDGRPAAYLDGPGGTQVPDSVIDAMAGFMRAGGSNHGGPFASSPRDRCRDRVCTQRHRRPLRCNTGRDRVWPEHDIPHALGESRPRCHMGIRRQRRRHPTRPRRECVALGPRRSGRRRRSAVARFRSRRRLSSQDRNHRRTHRRPDSPRCDDARFERGGHDHRSSTRHRSSTCRRRSHLCRRRPLLPAWSR